VRYHLDLIPNAVDLSTWRLSLEGNVERPLHLAFDELVENFKAVSSRPSISVPGTVGVDSSRGLRVPVGNGRWGTPSGPGSP